VEYSKDLATSFFNGLGYSVSQIPETTEKRADLLVHDGIDHYVIEVKEKHSTGSQIRSSKFETEAGIVDINQEPHKRWNALQKILIDASVQLASTPQEPDYFNLIWFHVISADSDMTARRAIYTFYGVADIVPRSHEGPGINCVYFDANPAYAMPNVDGLIISENNGAQLCLNEFSMNHERFRSSKLVKVLGESVYDPRSFNESNGKIVLRSNVSRNDESIVLDAVEQQTGVRYVRVHLNRYTFAPADPDVG